MAFIRKCFVIAITMLCVLRTNAQTVSYPLQSSQLLKSTAEDAAMLLQKAVAGSNFSFSAYTGLPQTGIVFIYDSTISHNQMCRVESDGLGFIKFSASQDNGLCFGFYQYLQNLGFRFYQPGTAWEIIPSLSSAYRKMDTVYSTNVKYNSWFISGGHNRWVMDNNTSFGWDTYFGDNGHNWALYQRRNCMTGEYRFAGHLGGIMTGSSLSTWQNNPCYVASYDNSRQVNSQAVPDVNSAAAMQLWSSTIEQNYTANRNNILGNINLYVNQYCNFNYNNFNVGIEVPDGAHWGNTKDNLGCTGNGYAKESDQNITLANYTAQKIGSQYPNLRFQLYAYSTHADVPSANISLNEKLDVQLIPVVYQNLTSTNGLRNRWYNRTKNISEYNYLNLSGWSGETPSLDLNDFKATLQIAKDKKSQGLVWEASPAKFASLPFLLAANKNLKDNIAVDSSLLEFCNNMFAGAGKTIYGLLRLWTDNNSMAAGVSNQYKLPLYFEMVNTAEQQIAQESEIVKQRLRELKAYLHYMSLYYNWAADQRLHEIKKDKATDLCLYLAKINKLQLVNSYFLVSTVVSHYSSSGNFYQQYNVANGTAYQNGNLPLITAAEIDNDFRNDLAKYSNSISKYKFEPVAVIADRFDAAGLKTLDKVSVKLNYTNGMDYYNRCEFSIKAPKAGSFTINYNPTFEMPDKGYINFTVESTDKALQVLEDYSIDQNAKAGTLTITLPVAGNYKMTVSSKYKSSVELNINTNKNIFYKSGAFFGSATEIYQNNIGMPGYFYIPAGINKIYFSLGNSNPGGAGFASAEIINNAFAIQDNNGKKITARFVTPTDSALFYIEIPQEAAGKFCQITKKANYTLVFANISNYVWYAQPKPLPCSNADFTVTTINRKGNCITQLTAVSNSGQFEWEVVDLGKTYSYSNQRVIELPDYSSPNAVVTLTNGANCSITKKIGDDKNFLKAKQACASGAPLPEVGIVPAIYPNPSTGVFKCMQNGNELTANQVFIMNAQGNKVAVFNNTSQFNISNVPAGTYWYKIEVKGMEFSGKLLKL
ncbi:MAG: T9SS type A sorting domain-containing protein [Ferruginibacter sp.]